MPTTGIHAQAAASNRHFMETRNVKPSETIVFRAATKYQVMIAIEDEEKGNGSATINLAKQGLYDPNNPGTIFHVSNVITPKSDGTYKQKRSELERILSLVQENAALIYVN